MATAGFVVWLKTWPAPPVAKQRRGGVGVGHLSARIDETNAGDAAARILQQPDHDRVIDDLDRRAAGNLQCQHAADLPPGRVARVQDTTHRVRALTGQIGFARRTAIEIGAPGQQFVHRARAIRRQDVDGPLVAQSVSGGQRVRGVARG